jgi:AcrR family transcriptional regulator
MSEAWPSDRRRPPQPRAGQERSRGNGDRARDTILRAAASMATVRGLDGLTIGNVAAAVGMSRSDLRAYYGSKGELQLATVTESTRVFDTEVVQPALAAPAGLGQLAAVCEAFFAHLERRTFPGGCFMASAALEMSSWPGPVRDFIAASQARFGDLIRGFAATALARNELPAGENPDRLAFELNGIMLAADTNFVLHDDPAVLDLARQIVRQRLGADDGP